MRCGHQKNDEPRIQSAARADSPRMSTLASSHTRSALLWLISAFGATAVARYEHYAHPTAQEPSEPGARAAKLIDDPAHRQANALRDGQRIDINSATAAELELLPHVGPSLARKIVEARSQRGGVFRAPEDLLQVRGVGQKTLTKLRPFLRFGPSEELEHAADAGVSFAPKGDVPRLQEAAAAQIEAERPSATEEIVHP